ncbi:MAG: hypothetical protein L0216_17375 [Planctomycetales bacterium]|nr:hypothetical protein [Planctomycetales bacterium]
MGGWGSGPPRRWTGLVGESYRLDILGVYRGGGLVGDQVWEWKREKEVLARIGTRPVRGSGRGCQTLGFAYVVDQEEVSYAVTIEWTACGYGGARPWFRCPAQGCGRRCGLIYFSGRYFACRACSRLTYRCRRRHRDLGAELASIRSAQARIESRLAKARYRKRRAQLTARVEDLLELECMVVHEAMSRWV